MGQVISFVRKVMCFPIKLYQYVIRPYIKPCCRFYPSCSQYAVQAIEQLGVVKGLWWAAYRLLRCHPWTAGGYDPVLPNHKENH